MAGITNAAYRRLCREQGAGLYVCEMITSRGVVERDETTMSMLVFDELEDVRSVQLYGTDPVYVGKAAEILCAEYGVAHIDLNFGCPVPKVTRKGGGGALPWKRRLLGEILTSAVKAAEPYAVPVTMKTRKGIDDDHLTYLDAGRVAQESGAAAIALHGRTVSQAYSGLADWEAIGNLVQHVDIPVLGNGDIWEAADAIRMVRETGAAGVVVGRGCLGRPWLFRDLAAAFAGEHVATLPTLGEVAAMMRRHAELLCFHMGEERGCKEFRKHIAWYLKGFRAGGELRKSL
ncbi:MAG TPA: tRNA dihydrouridine synthase DusB, partial [Nocardioidaceae bacterium]|nr:tRNA dihydrouridine synthase DusB [Nocardioidaceae bacterium]